MADQQFLASFGVDIDESGVSRLQTILAENRMLGDSLAAAFGEREGFSGEHIGRLSDAVFWQRIWQCFRKSVRRLYGSEDRVEYDRTEKGDRGLYSGCEETDPAVGKCIVHCLCRQDGHGAGEEPVL